MGGLWEAIWWELPNIRADPAAGPYAQGSQVAGAGEGPEQVAESGQPEKVQRQPAKERWEVALGPWRQKIANPSPRDRKRKQQAARRRDKENSQHPYQLRNRKGKGDQEEQELSD